MPRRRRPRMLRQGADDPKESAGGSGPAEKPSNVVNRPEFGHGDLEKGFAKADVIIERRFRTEATHQGYIEPHACLASVGTDGQGEIWGCTQGHFMVRNVCAALLGMDVSKLRFTASEIGGGFGGKTTVFLEPVALALSRKSGRPVKMVMSREEVFRASGPTSSTTVDVKIGANKDGRITAAVASCASRAAPSRARPSIWAPCAAFACYDLENVKAIGYDVVCNRPKQAAYRAPGAPMAAFGVESVIQELAQKIGMDPIEFRLKNAAKEGTKSSYGPTFGPVGLIQTLEAAKNHPHYKAPLGPNRAAASPRLLVQFRRPDLRLAQRQYRRHRGAGGGHARYRRLARLHVPDGGGGARHSL